MKPLISIALFLMIFPAFSAAAPVPPLEALERLRSNFAGLNDFTADITQEKQLSVMKRKLTASGSVKFKKPDLFLMELKPPYPSKMLLRDSMIDLYLPQEKSRQQIALPPEEGLKKWLSLLSKPLTSLPEAVEIKADRSTESQMLAIYPKNKGQIRSIAITTSNDGKIQKLVIEERNGNRTAISFSNMKLNTGITEKAFTTEP